MSDNIVARPDSGRTLPAVVYGLYLIGIANILTIFIGLIIAYTSRGGSDPRMESHYTFLIRTFWLSIGWALIGGLMVLVGIPFSFVLVGIPVVALGVLILSVIGVWFAVRCIVGVIHLSRDEAYPRPYSWLI